MCVHSPGQLGGGTQDCGRRMTWAPSRDQGPVQGTWGYMDIVPLVHCPPGETWEADGEEDGTLLRKHSVIPILRKVRKEGTHPTPLPWTLHRNREKSVLALLGLWGWRSRQKDFIRIAQGQCVDTVYGTKSTHLRATRQDQFIHFLSCDSRTTPSSIQADTAVHKASRRWNVVTVAWAHDGFVYVHTHTSLDRTRAVKYCTQPVGWHVLSQYVDLLKRSLHSPVHFAWPTFVAGLLMKDPNIVESFFSSGLTHFFQDRRPGQKGSFLGSGEQLLLLPSLISSIVTW